jgi:hypothetical protein
MRRFTPHHYLQTGLGLLGLSLSSGLCASDFYIGLGAVQHRIEEKDYEYSLHLSPRSREWLVGYEILDYLALEVRSSRGQSLDLYGESDSGVSKPGGGSDEISSDIYTWRFAWSQTIGVERADSLLLRASLKQPHYQVYGLVGYTEMHVNVHVAFYYENLRNGVVLPDQSSRESFTESFKKFAPTFGAGVGWVLGKNSFNAEWRILAEEFGASISNQKWEIVKDKSEKLAGDFDPLITSFSLNYQRHF